MIVDCFGAEPCHTFGRMQFLARSGWVFSGAVLLSFGCSSPQKPARSDEVAEASRPVRAVDAHSPGYAKPKPSEPPSGKKLTVAQARKRMLELINRDRATMGLPPVALDDGAAQVAGQRHAEDMAKLGFLGHWGSDGSVPEQRYSEAGGTDFVMENASCVTDEKTRELDPLPMIDEEAIERAESMFFNETPPNDGHRKNILKKEHKKVGLGFAQAKATPTELPGLCLTQEFIDPYGTYQPIPRQAKAGSTLHVAGTIHAPAKLGGVGISRIDMPKPIAVSEVNKRRSYSIPEPHVVYWPKGFKTPIPVQVNGASFSIDVPLDKGPGLYGVAILGQYPGQKDFGMISLRTIEVK